MPWALLVSSIVFFSFFPSRAKFYLESYKRSQTGAKATHEDKG